MFESLQILEIGVGQRIQIDYQVYFWILMGLNLVLIAAAKTLNQSYISILFNTAVLNRQLLQKTQEELRLGSASSILLTFTYFSNLALLIAFASEQSYSLSVFIFLGVLIAAALFKWGSMWFLMFISESRSGITEHGMNHLIYYQVGGIILTPILFFTHFMPEAYYQFVVNGCLIFAALLLVVREIQTLGRAIKARISPLYIILYLCTLELMPFVLIIYAFVTIYAGLN